MRVFSVFLLTATIVFGVIGSASAVPIKDCGQMYGGTYRNITTRAVSCWEARKVIKGWQTQVIARGKTSGWVRGLKCKYVSRGYEQADHRCTGSSGRVGRWQLAV